MTDQSAGDVRGTVLAGGGEMGALMRAHDWSATPLGPIESWPQSLRSVVSTLLPSRAQIILFWGPEFTVLYNDAYRPVFGAKHPAALGRPSREAWSELWDEMLHDLLAGVVRTGEAFWAKDLLFVVERHGFVEETYFDVSYDPVRVESGAVGGVNCIVTETTERVVAARRLALLKDLAHASHVAAPRDACVAAIETLAHHQHDIVFALAYLDGELQCCTPEAEARLAAASSSQVHELAMVSTSVAGPSGRLVLGVNPRRPFDAEYRGFLDLVAHQLATAIASAHAYEQEKLRAETLAKVDRAKTAFFSNVSHEFRTPLTLILGPVEDMLASNTTRPEDRDRIALVHRNSLRLLKLVNMLLDFSRIEAGRVLASFEATDLAAFTIDLASAFRSAIERAGMTLVVDCPPLGDLVYVDRDMWEKIVLNLLSNAFKYTLRGRITVSLHQVDGAAVLSVTDTGVGIPQDELPRVFDRFHRVESVHGRTHEGSGIGLALVRELVRLHGGLVIAESVHGRGSTFRVTVPLGTAHLPADRIGTPRTETPTALGASPYVEEALRWLPESADATTGSGVEPVLHRMPRTGSPAAARARSRVLLADDNADMRDYVARMLREQYDVEAVPDGRAALAAARRETPDLILTDVMMPVMDGFGLLRDIRNDPALRTTPVLLLSARAGEEARVEGWEAGADDYLVKPFSARELMARVGTHLEMARVRRDAEQAIRQSEERFRAFTRATSDVVYCMSADWREMRYLQGREFIADTLHPSATWLETYIHPDDQPHVQAAIERAIQTKSTLELEHRVIRVDGTLGWIVSRAIPILDGDGSIVEWFGAATDVTRRKEDEQRHREADRRKDEFLATLAHELRNPLAPIRTGLELIRLGGSTPAAIERVRAIMERQIGHMVRLIDDLLDMSRITSGKIQLQRQPSALSDLVDGAIEATRTFVTGRNVSLTVNLPDAPCVLDVDRTRFVQILSNLLHNAAKFTEPGGGIEISAELSARDAFDRQELALTVADTGIGISREMLPRVFDLFTQEERAGAQGQGGLGIGLALVRRLVDMHGGRVEAHSEGRGLGTQVILRLPVSHAQPAAGISTQREDAAMVGCRVLVVDDNEDAARTLAMLVDELGGEARVASNGAGGLRCLTDFQPEVVLLDIGMPGMDGYETCRRMRATPAGSSVVVVALTGWGQEDDKQRALDAGFDLHMTKPADPSAVGKLLADIARTRKVS